MPATDYTRVTVYLTEDEKETIQAQADEAGLKLSSYIKQQLLGDNQETTMQINRIQRIVQAKEQIQVVINSLLNHSVFDNVALGYPKSVERVNTAIEQLKTVDVRNDYGQAGKTILSNQIQRLEDMNLYSHSGSVVRVLGDVVSALANLHLGMLLKDKGETMHD